jgi:hypothetical protein
MPRFSGRLFRAALAVTAVISLAIKLFTAEIHSSGDPSVYLVLAGKPFPTNRLIANERPKGLLLLEDENGYPGSGVYAAFVSWAWLLAPAALAMSFLNRSDRIRHA